MIEIISYILKNLFMQINNDKGGQVYSSSDLSLSLRLQRLFRVKNSLKNEANKLRDWQWMWSYFYFYKKNYNYFYALIKISGSF